ncbi:MAG: hypothetical protein B6D62_03065 [Candidatus Cloacimonas sp. 4484_275]|nr:MAG: hypothetical protein B6D62_03065 [Candidatus Cloacimonas sp. 4484_275]
MKVRTIAFIRFLIVLLLLLLVVIDTLIINHLQKKLDQITILTTENDSLRKHEGIDLFVPENTPVYPIADYGIVMQAEDNPHFLIETECKRENGVIDTVKVEYGKIVRILYPEGIETLYAHLNKIFVKTGETVTGSTKVGLTGLTGNIRRSGKPSHLHLELRDAENKTFNPKHRLFFHQGSVKNFLKNLKLE